MMRRNRWMAGWVPLVCAWMALPAGAQNQPHKTVLRLVDTKAFPSGVIVNTYRPVAA